MADGNSISDNCDQMFNNLWSKKESSAAAPPTGDIIRLVLTLMQDTVTQMLARMDPIALRQCLFSKDIVQHSEFVQLAIVCDNEGPAAHAELILSTIMAKPEDKQEAFLQEIQGIHPELYSFILEHTDVAKYIGEHIKQTYMAGDCHNVQALPGENFRLNLLKDEYKLPLVLETKKLELNQQEHDWLSSNQIRHNYFKAEFKTMEDIVIALVDSPSTTILCMGIPGIGKTICAKRLISSWVSGCKKLKYYDIIMLIPVRHVNTSMSLIDILEKDRNGTTLLNNSMKETLTSCLNKKHFAERVLVIVDGVDECEIRNDSELYHFITGLKFPHVKKLITARSEASLLVDLFKDFFPHYMVNIEGTTKAGIHSFLKAIMSQGNICPSPEQVNSLLHKCEYDMIQFEELSIPLYLTLIGFHINFHWAKHFSFSRLQMLHTTTSLFHSFLHILIRIWLQKLGRQHESDLLKFDENPIGPSSSVPIDIKNKLFTFGRISYDFLLSKHYTFKEADFKAYFIDIADVEQSGMFGITKQEGEKQCFYTHKLFQDFMAALYISQMQLEVSSFAKGITASLENKHYTLFETFPRMSLVFKFLCVLHPMFVKSILKKLQGRLTIAQSAVCSDLDLSYEASIFSEVQDPILKQIILSLITKADPVTRLDVGCPAVPMAALCNLCSAFTIQQVKLLLSKFYKLYMSVEHGNICLSNIEGNPLGGMLQVNHLHKTLYTMLLPFHLTNVKELTIATSQITNIKLLVNIFPNIRTVSIEDCADVLQDKALLEMLFRNLPNVNPASPENSAVMEISLGTKLLCKTLPISTVINITQEHPCLKSLRLYHVDILTNLRESTQNLSQLAWQQLNTLEICIYQVESEADANKIKDLLWLLQHKIPNVTSFTLGTSNYSHISMQDLILQSLTHQSFTRLRSLRLFNILDGRSLVQLGKTLPQLKNLQTFGLGWEELRGVTDVLLGYLANSPQITHFQVGFAYSSLRAQCEEVCHSMSTFRGPHFTPDSIEVGLYNYSKFKYESLKSDTACNIS